MKLDQWFRIRVMWLDLERQIGAKSAAEMESLFGSTQVSNYRHEGPDSDSSDPSPW